MKKSQSNVTQRDLELLSVYIDGQLGDRQARKLEARLRHEPDLKRELEELRITVRALAELPAPRPSRHFMLTPEMAGQRPVSRRFPVLRFATALAGLAFIFFVGLEGLLAVSGSQMASRAPAVMPQAEQAQDAITGAEEPMMAAAPEEEVPAEREAIEMPAEVEAEEAPEALMMEAPAAEEEPAEAEDQFQKLPSTPQPTIIAAEEELEADEGRVNALGESGVGDEALVEAQIQEATPVVSPTATYFEREESPAIVRISPLRWLQVSAGALFILLSVLTITFRKRSI
jgi:hypothetical protein